MADEFGDGHGRRELLKKGGLVGVLSVFGTSALLSTTGSSSTLGPIEYEDEVTSQIESGNGIADLSLTFDSSEFQDLTLSTGSVGTNACIESVDSGVGVNGGCDGGGGGGGGDPTPTPEPTPAPTPEPTPSRTIHHMRRLQ